MNPLWPQLALTTTAAIVSVIGLQIPGYSWFVYFGTTVFILSLYLMFLESSLGERTKSKAKRIRDKRTLRRNEKEYLSLIYELRTLETLSTEVYKIPKSAKFNCHDYHPHNSIHRLSEKTLLFNRGDRILHANCILQEIAGSTEHSLYQYDLRLKSGEIIFNNEQELKSVQKALRKYESFIEKHNDLCRRVNSLLQSFHLSELDGYALTFDWLNAQPKNEN